MNKLRQNRATLRDTVELLNIQQCNGHKEISDENVFFKVNLIEKLEAWMDGKSI